MSIRGEEWQVFATTVHSHIEQYTVAQYGDKGEDLASEYTREECLKQVRKYLTRQGKNQREGQDQMDLLKAAHYLQLAWSLGND